MVSRSFGSRGPQKPHLSRGSGGLAGELADLRQDVDDAVVQIESKTGMPQLERVLLGGALSIAGVPINSDILGKNFLQGQTFDTLLSGAGTASLAVTANRPGDTGLRLAVIQGGGALSVIYAAGLITVTLAVGGSTAAAVKAAWDAVASVLRQAQVAVSGGGGGTVLAAAEAPLVGGVGSSLSVKINGLEQDIDDQVSDTNIDLVVTSLAGLVNLDQALLVVTSNGASDQMAVRIVT